MTRKAVVRLAAGAALASAAAAPALADPPAVVASIMPVHSLVAGVMGDVGAPALLVEGGGSPHSYSLRPSEAAALQKADVVFWIGAELETFLERPLAALPRGARIVALHEAEGVTLLPYREDDDVDEHGHGDHAEEKGHDDHGHGDHAEEEGHDDHGHGDHAEEKAHDDHGHGDHAEAEGHDDHGHGETDMHVWLDPVNAQAMVKRIAAALGEADPANASKYQSNAANLEGRLADLDAGLARDLAPVKERPYVVFHDAYAYFEKRYGLTHAGSITVDPDRQPGAKRLFKIREKIAETGAACVFSEPQFEPALVETVIEGTKARTGVLDPLGADLAPGMDAYFTLMRNLAASLKGCLNPAS